MADQPTTQTDPGSGDRGNTPQPKRGATHDSQGNS